MTLANKKKRKQYSGLLFERTMLHILVIGKKNSKSSFDSKKLIHVPARFQRLKFPTEIANFNYMYLKIQDLAGCKLNLGEYIKLLIYSIIYLLSEFLFADINSRKNIPNENDK